MQIDNVAMHIDMEDLYRLCFCITRASINDGIFTKLHTQEFSYVYEIIDADKLSTNDVVDTNSKAFLRCNKYISISDGRKDRGRVNAAKYLPRI